jgi:hypothetical protein
LNLAFVQLKQLVFRRNMLSSYVVQSRTICFLHIVLDQKKNAKYIIRFVSKLEVPFLHKKR